MGTGVDDSNIHGALKAVNQYIAHHNMFKYGAIGCYGNAVMGGRSLYFDRYGNKTSVPKALRTSIMGITCYIALEENGLISKQ